MDEGKKYSWGRRRAYLDDFRRTVSGEYIYIGKTYAFSGTKKERKRGLILWGLQAVVMAAMAMVGGCIYAPGLSYCAYILIPYVAGLLAAWSVLWGFVRLAWGGDPLREYVYSATVKQFRLRTVLAAVCSAAAIAAEILYVALHGVMDMLPGMVIFLVSQMVVLILALLWQPLGRNMAWELQENSEQ